MKVRDVIGRHRKMTNLEIRDLVEMYKDAFWGYANGRGVTANPNTYADLVRCEDWAEWTKKLERPKK